MTFRERALWAWNLQKEVARIIGITKWGPALKRKMEIDDEEIFPLILRESKSAYNRKSVAPVRYDKIPDDMVYELSSHISFGGPFVISYSGGADPQGEYGKYSDKTVSVSFVEENKVSREVLFEVFRFLVRALEATEASLSDNRYSGFFKDKVSIRVQDGDRTKIVRYMWTGLYTFLPDQLLAGFDLSEYPHEAVAVEGHGVIVSMEGVTDIDRIMDYNRKVAALYGTIID